MRNVRMLRHHPVPALIWECWRLSRRWYLWVLPAVLGIDLFFMSQADTLIAGQPVMRLSQPNASMLLAPNVFMINFTVAVFTTLLALAVGGRSGFPLVFEYRLPVRTHLLAAVPMLTLTTLCASLYFLPMLICRLYYGTPFPLLAPSVLIGVLVIILLASSWVTTSTNVRTATILFAVFNSVQLFAFLDPIDLRFGGPNGPPRMHPDFVLLSPGEYALVAGIALLLFAFIVAAIRKQRYSDTGRTPGGPTSASRVNMPVRLSALLERVSDLLTVPCPTSAPWRAELWLELKRQGIPVLLLGLVLALLIPLLFAIFVTADTTIGRLDYLFPLIIVFTGVGIAVFKRREPSGGYMSAFEATRGMSTIGLALLQMLALGATILCAIVLVCVSVYFSTQLFADTPGALALRLQRMFAAERGDLPLLVLSEAVMRLVVSLSVIALLACVHTWSVVWGRLLPYGAGIVAIYALIFASRVQSGSAVLEDIKTHMWGFAAVVVLLTLAALGRTLHLKILPLRAGLVTLLCWAVFVACSLYSLAQQGIVVVNQAPELRAFNAALLLLPFTLCVLLFWSYDRLRHR